MWMYIQNWLGLVLLGYEEFEDQDKRRLKLSREDTNHWTVILCLQNQDVAMGEYHWEKLRKKTNKNPAKFTY